VSEERDTTQPAEQDAVETVDGVHEPESEAPDEADLAHTTAAHAAGTGDAATDAPEAEGPDYKDLYLRAAAEADNVRKRARRDVDAAQARGVARLARELLPSLDNLDRALAHAEAEEADAEHHLTKGIRLVQQELLAALTRVGIEPYSPEGEEFDPHVHEAVAQQPRDGAASGTVVQVYQQGYRYKDEILRPAKVVVAA
jgi:molecular chaperone GrpE